MKLSSSRIYGTLIVDVDINLSGKINGLTLGSVSEVNLNNSTSNYLRGDGTWATPPNSIYSHPSHPGDDISLDTGALSGATVISDIDWNITTDTLGHVTDATLTTLSTRELTPADIGALPEGGTAAAANTIKVNNYDGATLMKVLGSHQTGGSDNVYSTAGVYFDASIDVLYTSGGNSNEWNTGYDHSKEPHASSNAQVNVKSDWNATSGDAEILNKPTFVYSGGILTITVV